MRGILQLGKLEKHTILQLKNTEMQACLSWDSGNAEMHALFQCENMETKAII